MTSTVMRDAGEIIAKPMDGCQENFLARKWLNENVLGEGIDHRDFSDLPAVLKVLSKKDPASCLARGANDQSVPEGEPMEAVKINGGQDVIHTWSGDVGLGK